MASLDSLAEDQRAVLQLVLQRRRSYDEIARLLSIDRAAVRERALTAFDLLGPQTGLADQRRALITDYLLGQLPPRIREQTRDRLAQSPSERAWAKVLASEIAPLADGPLPEIPVERVAASTAEAGPPSAEPPSAEPPWAKQLWADLNGAEPRSPAAEPASPGRFRPGPSSRRGGPALILSGVVIAVVVIAVLANSGGSKNTTVATTRSTAAVSTTATSSTPAHVIAQINLMPPSSGGKAAGIAEVLKQGSNDGLAIVAQNVPPNTTTPPNAYAVWLYNSPTDAHMLGFVNPGVTSTGRLSTAGGLPTNASHFMQLIVTVETKANPTAPGTIILQGTLAGL